LGNTLGDFLTNSSGHPDQERQKAATATTSDDVEEIDE
jgi:hypothetical protein